MLCGVALSMICWATSVAAQSAKVVSPGENWVVEKTTQLRSLTIGEGAHLNAPKGYSLTMTVNGTETEMRPGSYNGKIVLTDTQDILVPYMGMKGDDPYHFRTAVYINDGAYVADKSVAAAAPGATVTNAQASNLNITSKAEKFNGIIVTGNSNYTLNNVKIDMNGNGRNDFAGYGAAIMGSGNAKLTINKANIVTHGAVRTAIWVGGKSTVTVNDSFIETYSGTLPAGYQFSIMPGAMMEVPYGLGIAGNVRATNLIDNGTVYYNNVHVRAHGWGALSSDGDGPTRMYVKDSLIETIDDGYGAFANGDSHDHFNHCTFNVADVALIIGGNGSGTFTDGTVVNSNKLGVMMHQGTGGGVLTIEKGSSIHSKWAAIEVKGRGTTIVVDNAKLQADNGVLLQTMDNDDPIMREMAKQHSADMPGAAAAPAAGEAPKSFSGNVVATFKNETLNGDMVHAMKGIGNMSVALENSTVTGAISLGEASPFSGQETSRETFRTIGHVKNTLGPTTDKFGLKLSLDGHSRWVVEKSSYLTELNLADGATIAAPSGSTVSLLVNGAPTAIKAGNYTGKIELQVASGR
jgi:hypothetical protein